MKALLVVDMQNDFSPQASSLVFVVNAMMEKFPLVVASKDWHPRDHISFTERGGPWPVHCVKETKGAEFVFGLNTEKIAKVFYKGLDSEVENYSAFDKTELDSFLKENEVTELFVAGVATDYCILHSALAAVEHGFDVAVIRDACKKLHEEEEAISKMQEKGVKIIKASEVL
ncbi:MAG: isochorismatase family protein [Simkaniaceae bacterium]|nr:isochorismatase family protein [Candidatus Sacchlamyda saccharinae]